MAIVQISKIQQRSGNIVDLPQLDEAEFGFASDAKRLFIGKVSPNENIEVLTSYSNIAFSQIEGAVGNLDISAISVDDGQVLAYDGTNWVNRGGTAGGLIDLGSVANVSISGGAIGYVLETDGLGNLAWTPKGTLYTPIIALSNATPIIMTVANTVPYTNGTAVTITGANGANANSIVNGQTFYITLATDYATSGNVKLYTDSGRTTAAVGTNLGASTANVAVATSVISGTGGGTGVAGGSNSTIQFNNSGVLDGDSDFTWNNTTNLLTVSGNVNAGNLNATTSVVASTLTSNVADGTAPLTVTSTTRVANLNVAYANVADFINTNVVTTGTFYPVLANATSGNVVEGANANLAFNAATGNLKSTLFYATSTVTAVGNVAGGNITTAGAVAATGNVSGGNITTGGVVTATGNITGGNVSTAGIVTASRLISNIATGTAPFTVTSTTTVANLAAATATTAGTVTTAAQPNITSVGTLTSLTVSGTITANDISTYGSTGDDLNITGGATTTLNDSGGNINITSGTGNGTGAGGGIYAYGGNASATGNAAGGLAILSGGAGYGQGQGGTVAIASGASANTYGAKGGNVVITGGTYDGAGGDMTIAGGEAAGLNHIGGDISIKAGASTGNATPGKIVIQTATAGSTGNTVQTLSDRVIIDDTQMNVRFTTASSSTTTGALEVAGGVGVGGNVYAAAFYGAATGLTSIPGANVSGTVANATHSSTANTVTNAAQGNITSVGTLTGLAVASGSITATTPVLLTQTWNNSSVAFTGFRQNITNTASASGSYLMDLQVGGTSKFVVARDGSIVVGESGGGGVTANVLTTGANTTAGLVTGNWTLTAGSRFNATYADLAEYYEADVHYEPGTVLEFGGEKEVTIAEDGTARVAGVVSTDPAFAMHAKCQGIAVAIALQGRVPVKVRGNIRKGDMMVSAGNGYARPTTSPIMGSVIGKALENFDGVEGVIEIAVGRL
jgi:hypothetical protein